MYKLSEGILPNNLQMKFYVTRRLERKCQQPKLNASMAHLSTIRLNFFTSTGPAIYNLLPANLKEARSLDSFKHLLDTFLKKIPDLPPTPGYPSLNKNTLLEWVTGSYNYADVITTLAAGGTEVEIQQSGQGAEVHPYSS